MAKQKQKIKVDYYVFQDNDSNGSVHVIVEDGGVATAYKPDNYYVTEYYGSRITPKTSFVNLWNELGEGKLYNMDWDGSDDDHPLKKDKVDDEVIMDMVHWLYTCTEEVEFVRHEMEWNRKNFIQVRKQLKFDEL